jgi:hypothetical protein
MGGDRSTPQNINSKFLGPSAPGLKQAGPPREIFGRENVSYTLTKLGKVTTAQAKVAERARLQQIFEQTGFILIGN